MERGRASAPLCLRQQNTQRVFRPAVVRVVDRFWDYLEPSTTTPPLKGLQSTFTVGIHHLKNGTALCCADRRPVTRVLWPRQWCKRLKPNAITSFLPCCVVYLVWFFRDHFKLLWPMKSGRDLLEESKRKQGCNYHIKQIYNNLNAIFWPSD